MVNLVFIQRVFVILIIHKYGGVNDSGAICEFSPGKVVVCNDFFDVDVPGWIEFAILDVPPFVAGFAVNTLYHEHVAFVDTACFINVDGNNVAINYSDLANTLADFSGTVPISRV